MKRQAGFTLIEIAIVLVIIGLLLGGVLKGQEMINNSKIKRVVNDFNGVAAAIYSYLDRYGAFPGDEATARTTARWGVPGGNGNGVIGTTNCYNTGNNEESLLWVHLRNSGLVSGSTLNAATTGQARPTNGFGGLVCVEDAKLGLTGPVICMSRIDGRFAEIIDRQMDDGDGTTGTVRGNTNQNATTSQAYAEGTITNICSQL